MKEETTGKAQEMMDLFAPIVRYGYNRAIIEIGEYLAEIDKLDTGDIYALLSKKLEGKADSNE